MMLSEELQRESLDAIWAPVELNMYPVKLKDIWRWGNNNSPQREPMIEKPDHERWGEKYK